jgi:hypothetical protein
LEKSAEFVGIAAQNSIKIIKMAQMAAVPNAGAPKKPGFFQEDSLDKAFENITVKDVAKRLQALSTVFKNREIARQLSIIDLMLDKLGIAGLFPQLAEATKSALESNQYSSIRIEEVLSKLMSVIDEQGNVNINITNKEEESFVDKEMSKALQQGEAIEGQPGATPQIPAPGAPPGPVVPPPIPPAAGPTVPPIPPMAPGV